MGHSERVKREVFRPWLDAQSLQQVDDNSEINHCSDSDCIYTLDLFDNCEVTVDSIHDARITCFSARFGFHNLSMCSMLAVPSYITKVESERRSGDRSMDGVA